VPLKLTFLKIKRK